VCAWLLEMRTASDSSDDGNNNGEGGMSATSNPVSFFFREIPGLSTSNQSASLDFLNRLLSGPELQIWNYQHSGDD